MSGGARVGAWVMRLLWGAVSGVLPSVREVIGWAGAWRLCHFVSCVEKTTALLQHVHNCAYICACAISRITWDYMDLQRQKGDFRRKVRVMRCEEGTVTCRRTVSLCVVRRLGCEALR